MRIPRRNATVSQVDIHTAKPDTFADSQQCSSSSGSSAFYGYTCVRVCLFLFYEEIYFKKTYPSTGDSPDNYKNE